MRFGVDLFHFPGVFWLLGGLVLVLGFGALLAFGSVLRVRAEKRFGDRALVEGLTSFSATGRRAVKGVLLVLALAAALFSLARPEYGSGVLRIPATNLDVVVVLDYSKSMYARDVVPSRIARAKAETARLIQKLQGARFGAVAFAGEPISFPLTSDGGAIAQFFRQLEPNDMPVGGTATAKALERARELFARDPKAHDHVRVIVLITDGEDLEGNPEEVAERAAAEGTRIHVVQIGGRAPEIIPDVDETGKVIGLRKDDSGQPLTTELTQAGEEQLAKVATVSGGQIVQSEKGETGIDKISALLSKMMREELSEKVQTVWAEAYAWPLGFAVLLLVVEGLFPEAPTRHRLLGSEGFARFVNKRRRKGA